MKYLGWLLWLLPCGLWAQEIAVDSLQKLENERIASQKRIQEIDKILIETRQKHRDNEAELRALTTQTQNVQQLTATITKEIELLGNKIITTETEIMRLEATLKEYTDEYKAMVYMASKTNNKVEKLSFLFSSESVQQLMARMEYFDQYAESRKKQIEAIKKIRDDLRAEKADLEEQKQAKQELLRQKNTERQRLSDMRSERSGMLKKLRDKEQQLMLNLEKQKQIDSKLAEVLTSAVEVSMNTPVIRRNSENQINKASFAQNKSILLWPVKQGFVSRKFGKQPHPIEPKITVDNLGIDIRTPTNEIIQTIFMGTVVIVYKVPGDIGQTIMIQHDSNYFTVYKNVKNVLVKQGQNVKLRQHIGQVQENADGISELQFQIWQQKARLNPIDWLSSY